jgi:hypothetical protein
MKNIKSLLQNQLEREAKHNNPTRASEGVYALCLDLNLESKKVLAELKKLEIFPARRAPNHPSALELARTHNTEGLRRVTGRDLQLALQAAKPLEAGLLIAAWNLLSNYEQTRV